MAELPIRRSQQKFVAGHHHGQGDGTMLQRQVSNFRCFDPAAGGVLSAASLGIGIVVVAAIIVSVVIAVLIVDRRKLKRALAAATAVPKTCQSEHLEMIREEEE